MTLVTAGAVMGFGLSSCSDDVLDNLVKVSFTETVEVPFTLQPIDTIGVETPMVFLTTYFNLDSVIAAETNGRFDLAGIRSVTLNELREELDSTETDAANNLSNFEHVNLQFYSDAVTAPLTFPVMVPDVYSTRLTVPVDDETDLKPYMEGNLLTYSVSGKMRRTTEKTLTGVVTMRIKVEE